MSSLEEIHKFRETDINKYFRKLFKGADNGIPEYVKELRHEINRSYTENQIYDERQINFFRKRLSNPNNYFSINHMSMLYCAGDHIKQNIKMAIELSQMIIENDIIGSSHTRLGYIHTEILEYKDPQKAYEFTKIGSDKGNPIAMRSMGVMYEVGLNNITKNMNEALNWYIKSIENGLVGSKINVAIIYEKTDRFAEAFALYEDVINNDFGYYKASALCHIGHLTQFTYNINMNKAKEYYRKCIDFCSSKNIYNDILWRAANNAATVYYDENDYTEARKLYELAVKFTNEPYRPCHERLAFLYSTGKGGDVQIMKAIYIYNKVKLYDDIIKIINERLDNNQFLNELLNVLTYDDFIIAYQTCKKPIPTEIYELLEERRLADILVEI